MTRLELLQLFVAAEDAACAAAAAAFAATSSCGPYPIAEDATSRSAAAAFGAACLAVGRDADVTPGSVRRWCRDQLRASEDAAIEGVLS